MKTYKIGDTSYDPACLHGRVKQLLMQSLCLIGNDNVDNSSQELEFQKYYNIGIATILHPSNRQYTVFINECRDTQEGHEIFRTLNAKILGYASEVMLINTKPERVKDCLLEFVNQSIFKDFNLLISYISQVVYNKYKADINSIGIEDNTNHHIESEIELVGADRKQSPAHVDDSDCSCVIF